MSSETSVNIEISYFLKFQPIQSIFFAFPLVERHQKTDTTTPHKYLLFQTICIVGVVVV